MNLRELRKKKDLTQVQLSEQMGVSQSTICSWETGAAMPQASQLPKLADLLGVTIDALFGREPVRDGQNTA